MQQTDSSGGANMALQGNSIPKKFGSEVDNTYLATLITVCLTHTLRSPSLQT